MTSLYRRGKRISFSLLLFTFGLYLLTGCSGIKVKVQSDRYDPLQEFTLEGKGKEKTVLIPVRGVISNEPKRKLLQSEPSLVQEVVSHLKMAAEDPQIKAAVLQIDSPGGSVTASDILYREIQSFREKRSDVKVLSVMMNTAASGGYYVAMAGDRIIAHPTTITGSIGVIFIRPSMKGLMEKLGVGVEVTKSGQYKDMASPFRGSTDEERRLLQTIIEEMNGRFVELVAKNRHIAPDKAKALADGRIYTAEQALNLGLIDTIGYLNDAVEQAKRLADLPDDARLVVYRRTRQPNDNLYNTFTGRSGEVPQMIDLGLSEYLAVPRTGFYYLWAPEFSG